MRISDWSSDVCSSDLGQSRRSGVDPGISRQPARRHEGADRYRGTDADQVRDAEPRLPAGSGQLRRKRSEEHTSELQSLMRISYAVFCLTKKRIQDRVTQHNKPTKTQKNNTLD